MDVRLTSSESLVEGAALAARLETPDGPRALILVRLNGRVRAWLNSCPHTGVGLDWVPGRFMDAAGRYLVCATHGALFEPGSGDCVAGPCAGQHLVAVPVLERDGAIVADDALVLPASAAPGPG